MLFFVFAKSPVGSRTEFVVILVFVYVSFHEDKVKSFCLNF